MVTPNVLTTFNSVISALLYGLIFSFITNFIVVILKLIRLLVNIILTNRHNEKGDINKMKNNGYSQKPPDIITVIGILLFGLGFSIISYFSLDGCLRLYTIFSSFFGCWIIDKFVVPRFSFIFLQGVKILSWLDSKIQKGTKHLKMKIIFQKKSENTQTNDLRPS